MGKVAQNRFTVWLSRHKILASLLFLLGAFATLVAAMAFLPFKLQKLPESSPATSFEGAMMRLQAIIKAQNAQPELMPVCHTKVMSHGEKVENVIVLFHGLTSCPEQFAQLGEQFFGKGYNVIIPLQPHHGEKDRLNPSLPEMSSEELAQFATQYIDIARGLGENVTIAGISPGSIDPLLNCWIKFPTSGCGGIRSRKRTTPSPTRINTRATQQKRLRRICVWGLSPNAQLKWLLHLQK
jgi:hypothetical protein